MKSKNRKGYILPFFTNWQLYLLLLQHSYKGGVDVNEISILNFLYYYKKLNFCRIKIIVNKFTIICLEFLSFKSFRFGIGGQNS